MRYKGFDLNLLAALDILVEERSVSRAAEKMNMSQPAMSAALGRLRAYFDDPILGAHGKRMIPTAHALTLQPMLRDVLTSVEALLSVPAAFDPASSQRHFRIGASDYMATIVFNDLIARLQQAAPGVTLEIVPPFDGQMAMLDQGTLDVLLTPVEYCSPDHPTEHLFDESYVVLGCGDNPLLDRPMSEQDFFGTGHVVVEIGRSNRTSFAETNLRAFGARRRIEVIVASFLVARDLVINTNRLTVMQRRLAVAFSQRMNVRYADMPFAFPIMREMVQFNRTREADTGLRWMIDEIKNAVCNTKT